MRHEIPTTRVQYECDGCQYGMRDPEERPCIVVSVPMEYDGGDRLTFHFHGVQDDGYRDCFRYWAHNPDVMERSLRARGLDETDRDEFMYLMLYKRERDGKVDTFSPGVPRKRPAAA